MMSFGYEPLGQSLPEVLGFLLLLTRALICTKTLAARIPLFFLEKLLHEAPFDSDPNFRTTRARGADAASAAQHERVHLRSSPWAMGSSIWVVAYVGKHGCLSNYPWCK